MLVTWGSKGYYQKPHNKWSDSKEPLNSEKQPHPILWNDWLFIPNINLLRYKLFSSKTFFLPSYNSAMSNNLLLKKKFNSSYIILPLSGLERFRQLWHTLVLALKHPKVRLKQPKWPLLHVNFPHKSEMFNCHILINVSQSRTTSNEFT